MLNSRDISRLRPDVEASCRRWLARCREEGLNVLVTSTVRDREYQEWLYAQGRTRPGKIVTNGRRPTFHWDKAGLAFDFCKNVRGHEYDDPGFFRAAAELAKPLGFSWGGDWRSFPDLPHIQWDDHKNFTGSMILRGQLPPAMAPLEEEAMERYDTLSQCPKWAQPTILRLIERGSLQGNGTTDDEGRPAGLDLSRDMVRLLVIWEREAPQK